MQNSCRFSIFNSGNCNAVETWIMLVVLHATVHPLLYALLLLLAAWVWVECDYWFRRAAAAGTAWLGGREGRGVKKHSINQFFSPQRLLSVMMLSNNGSIHLGVGSHDRVWKGNARENNWQRGEGRERTEWMKLYQHGQLINGNANSWTRLSVGLGTKGAHQLQYETHFAAIVCVDSIATHCTRWVYAA